MKFTAKILKKIEQFKLFFKSKFEKDRIPTIINNLNISKSDFKTNILVITRHLTIGGADKVHLDIVKNLNKDLFDVHIITTNASANEWADRFFATTSKIIFLPTCVSKYNYTEFICQYIKHTSIDAILIANSKIGYKALPKIKKQYPKISLYDLMHGQGGKEDRGGLPLFSVCYDKYLDKRIVISNYLKNYLISNYKISADKIELIYNGFELLNENLHKTSKLNHDTTIAFVGRLCNEKRPLLVIDIANELINIRKYPVRFTIAGDGSLFDSIKNKISEFSLDKYVELLGYVENSNSVLSNSDLLILTSEMEGIPVVIQEAMSHKKAVITTNVGGVGEIVLDHKTGILVDNNVNIVNSFCDAIIELINNPKKQQEIEDNAFINLQNNFSSDQMILKYNNLFSGNKRNA